MFNHSLIAVFAAAPEAAGAKAALVNAGIAENAISTSTDYGADAIASEAPGQAYEHPPGVPETGAGRVQSAALGAQSRGSAEAETMADVERGSCVLTVDGVSQLKMKRVREILTQHGAVVIRER